MFIIFKPHLFKLNFKNSFLNVTIKLDYPYSYEDELIPETDRPNRNKTLTILLLIRLLKVR